MALIVLDPADIGIASSGKEDVVLQVSNVEGLDGLKFAVPWSRETTESVHKALGDIIAAFPPKVAVATLEDLKREADRHGLDTTAG